MPTSRHRHLITVLAVVALLLGPAPLAGADPDRRLPEDAPDELPAALDNAAEGHDTCGGEPVSPAGSEVHRKLVDGPRQPDGSLAFTAGICIYVPPGYRDGSLRYPVLYLLHGLDGWQDDWFVQGDAQRIADEATAADPADAMIIVSIDGGSGGDWRDTADGALANETYVFDHVIPYVDRWLRTIDDRRGRALAGLSNGGAGTLRMAAHNPDRFDVITAMSAALPPNMAADRTDIRTVWNDPTEVADNLELVELALIYGLTCGGPDVCLGDDPVINPFVWAFENACCSNEAYAAKLDLVRERPYRFERADGGHRWHFWSLWLETTHGPFIRSHLHDPVPTDEALPPLQAPATFALRHIDPVVEAYDHTFTTDPARATEMLTLTDVTAAGMTLAGSGTVEVRTAARHVPGVSYRVAGAVDGADEAGTVVVADTEGRLTFTVDLGPAHAHPEGSPEALAAGQEPTTRTVTISSDG